MLHHSCSASAHMKTPRLILRSPLNGDAAMLRNFEERNREHWSRWESTPIDGVKETSGERIKKWMHECKHNQSVRFLILPAENSGQIIGVCNFTQIFRGAFQACYLGYKLDHAFEGQGLMSKHCSTPLHTFSNILNSIASWPIICQQTLAVPGCLSGLAFPSKDMPKNIFSLIINGKITS